MSPSASPRRQESGGRVLSCLPYARLEPRQGRRLPARRVLSQEVRDRDQVVGRGADGEYTQHRLGCWVDPREVLVEAQQGGLRRDRVALLRVLLLEFLTWLRRREVGDQLADRGPRLATVDLPEPRRRAVPNGEVPLGAQLRAQVDDDEPPCSSHRLGQTCEPGLVFLA